MVPLLLHLCEDGDEDVENDASALEDEEKLAVLSKALNLFVSLTLPMQLLVPACHFFRSKSPRLRKADSASVRVCHGRLCTDFWKPNYR